MIFLLIGAMLATGAIINSNEEKPNPNVIRVCDTYVKKTECKSHWEKVGR